ncbi:GntR family transcriptional regulator [Desulfopila aestuarii]|uniref:DNA-binding transcriptional regulator, GntR family n=1 Tax=Desulfopila aestuarii DSM 18488 TaxID=1121416 RepID=A0A1M7XXW2_9BACT|nr:GntR family transcriptional regulator [Desulfopila aestuarii]SHO43788.1 DNA-binding transcriptional regulator, GntR family [Desulfopila aestuarii DSM 18488]
MKRNKNLTLKVYHRILELMSKYEIVPGQRLVFVDLARQLQVSRTPVNNALSILAQEGYLDFRPHQGYSVRNLSRNEAEDLYEIRDVLETGFMSQAIDNLTDDNLKKIEQHKVSFEKAISHRVHRGLFVLDTEFHLAILDLIGNEMLSSRYKEICQKIFLRIRIEQLGMERVEAIIQEHNQLYEAICNRDKKGARDMVLQHHENSRNSLYPILFPDEPHTRIELRN